MNVSQLIYCFYEINSLAWKPSLNKTVYSVQLVRLRALNGGTDDIHRFQEKEWAAASLTAV